MLFSIMTVLTKYLTVVQTKEKKNMDTYIRPLIAIFYVLTFYILVIRHILLTHR